ncbi:Uncharacterized membrane protein [Elusimicrobium minutum Pei191]|uniref:Uncharacterized membrane protein n=1 Tax=Elusimicrobium minutum (strain Pei191) TaxID=445932 RepID=B2KDK6_ELUMP|nr:VIT1/CCC1 family protein [Elusimicrobium minutum]ACC98602.1 Uncharacterized membrane protein [Elusimicrobium minutum Pei191]
MQNDYSPKVKKLFEKYQRDEETAHMLYTKIAAREKSKYNKKILMQIASDEKEHALVWKRYCGKNIKPSKLKFLWYSFLARVMGYTFVIKLMEKNEYTGINDLLVIENEVPEVKEIIRQEKEHEEKLRGLLDEDRLKYIGAIILGLNDALVELTGTIAGLTFALTSTKLVAVAGIITGTAATLSMAASNYLAERANGNPNALKASFYTGIAYLVTVILLVLPYLIYPNNRYILAFITTLAIMIFIIFFFNYYISVAKSLSFFKKFTEMACISLGVTLIAFGIGIAAKHFLNIDV